MAKPASDPRDAWSCPQWQGWCVSGGRKYQRPRYLSAPERFKPRIRDHIITFNKIQDGANAKRRTR